MSNINLENKMITDTNSFFDSLINLFKENKKLYSVDILNKMHEHFIEYLLKSVEYKDFNIKDIREVYKEEKMSSLIKQKMQTAQEALGMKPSEGFNDKFFYAYSSESNNYISLGKFQVLTALSADTKQSSKEINLKGFEKIMSLNEQIFNWIIANEEIYQVKAELFEKISKVYKKENLSSEQLKEKSLALYKMLEKIWLENYDKNRFEKEIFVTDTSKLDVTTPNPDFFSNIYQEGEKYQKEKALFTKAIDEKDIFYLIVNRNLDLNAIPAVKLVYDKWPDIIKRIEENLINVFPEKEPKKVKAALLKALRTSFGFHKVQEFAIKKQTDEGNAFNQYLMDKFHDIARKFQLGGSNKKILFQDDFFIVKQLRVEVSLKLDDFKKKQGFSRENINLLLNDISLFQSRQSEVKVFTKAEKNEINLVLIFSRIPKIEDKSEFVDYVSLKIYNKILKMLNIYRDNDLFKKDSNNYSFIDKNRSDFIINAEFDIINSWIREDKLLENMRLESERLKKENISTMKKKV